MFYLAFILIFISLSSVLFRFLNKKKKANSANNHYIRYHQRYLKDEDLYKEYLEWCRKNEKYPMDEKGFKDIRSRRDALKKLLESEL